MVGKMIKTGRDNDDPEVQKGLFDAARKIFMAKILKNLAEWKLGRGFLGIGWSISPYYRVAMNAAVEFAVNNSHASVLDKEYAAGWSWNFSWHFLY